MKELVVLIGLVYCGLLACLKPEHVWSKVYLNEEVWTQQNIFTKRSKTTISQASFPDLSTLHSYFRQ